jgi:UDP-N-acetylglucosamine acyltransferase
MGERNTVYPFACLGFAPQHLKFDHRQPGPGLAIGDDNVFREGATIHRAFQDDGPTRIGNHNFFMANSHAAHDAQVGDYCTIVNNALIGGHVTVQDRVTMGGGAMVHQFCRIGRGAMLSGAMGVGGDLPPWFTLTGNNVCGAINIVGLRRNGFSREQIDDVRWVYRTLYRSGLMIKHALERLREREESAVVREYIEFIEAAGQRPICQAKGKTARSAGAD